MKKNSAPTQLTVKTAPKAKPRFILKEITAVQHAVNGDYVLTDADNTLISYAVKLFKGDELVAENGSKEIAFESLDYYTEYTVKIIYTFDANDGKGVQEKVIERKIKTAPNVDVISLEVKNTAPVPSGEHIFLSAALDNPTGATIKTATINGVEYDVNGASSGSLLLVDILFQGQFATNEVTLSIEKLTFTIDSYDYAIDVATVCSDTVSTYVPLEILDAEMVNKDLESVDWISMVSKGDVTDRFILITLNSAKANEIKTIYVSGVGEEGGSELSLDFSDLELVDDTHVLIPLQDMQYYDRLGLSTFTVTINCENVYAEGYDINLELTPIYVVMDVIYISSAEEFISCPSGVYAELTCDLDFSDVSDFGGKYFEGVFNGNGYALKNVTITGDYSGKDVGIFKVFNGFLRNLNIENLFMHVSAAKNAAALIAKRNFSMARSRYARVENCTIDESSVISISNTGNNCAIFCGMAYNIDFINCTNYANASLGQACGYGVPGFVGGNSYNFKFTDCHNYGTITSDGEVFYAPEATEQP